LRRQPYDGVRPSEGPSWLQRKSGQSLKASPPSGGSRRVGAPSGPNDLQGNGKTGNVCGRPPPASLRSPYCSRSIALGACPRPGSRPLANIVRGVELGGRRTDRETDTGILPLIDVHTIEMNVSPDRAWQSVMGLVRDFEKNASQRVLASALGCTDRQTSGIPGTLGSTVPGFRVVAADPRHLLRLAGAHRFSRYELTFRVEPVGPGKSQVHVESRALFPGPHGTVYGALVIGSRGHVMAVKRMLRLIKHATEDHR